MILTIDHLLSAVMFPHSPPSSILNGKMRDQRIGSLSEIVAKRCFEREINLIHNGIVLPDEGNKLNAGNYVRFYF